MPAYASPFGLKIVKTQGGAITQAPERIILIAGNGSTQYPTVGTLYIPTSSSSASSAANPGLNGSGATANISIYANDPVYLDGSGGIAQTGAGNVANSFIIGTFNGVEYSDSSGKRTVSNKWIAGTGVQPGSEVWFWFTAASTADTIFEIQSSATLTASSIGQIYAVAYPTTPNAVTGFSTAVLDAATVVTAGNGGLQVYALAYDPILGTSLPNNGYAAGTPTGGVNNWGDAYVNVYVKLAKGQFTAGTTAF